MWDMLFWHGISPENDTNIQVLMIESNGLFIKYPFYHQTTCMLAI